MEFQYTTFEDELARHGWFMFTNVGRSMMPLLRENRDLMLVERLPEDADGRPRRCRKYEIYSAAYCGRWYGIWGPWHRSDGKYDSVESASQ